MTQEKIYESILHSYSPEKLEKELKKNFPYINFIDFTRGTITSRMKAVIKVDLKKNPRKIRLFDDPMMDIKYGLPLYTKEYISPSCLTDISSQFD